jgi:hypothetical protein
MKTIELQIKTPHKQVGLKMQGVSSNDHSALITNVFQFLLKEEIQDVKEIKISAPLPENIKPHSAEIKPLFTGGLYNPKIDEQKDKEIIKRTGDIYWPFGYKPKATEIIERAKQKQAQEEPKGSKPRQLPIIDREHSEIVSVGEALQKALEAKKSDDEDVPEHWHTGIKIDDDGTKRYRCRYECPSCGDKGKRYIPLGTESIQCRACEKELKVVAATGMWDPKGVPVRDGWGNYFMATTTIEKEDVLDGEE